MKKKSIKKPMSILLIIMLAISMMTGCRKSSTETNEASENPTETAANNAEVTPKSENDGTIKLPLTTEDITLTVFCPMNITFSSKFGSDYNESDFFKKLSEKTGIKFEFQTPATGQEQSAFNLMIASGELPDIIAYSTYYADGLDAAVDDGYYLDLTPYLDTYLYDYNQVRYTNEKYEKDTITDTGRIASIYTLYTEPQGPFAGLQIRQDWLDDLGLETPVTFDDWENVLIAFRDEKCANAPLFLGKNGYMNMTNSLSAGFGASYDFQQVNGIVEYGPITDGWRQYLTLMAKWYAEGLIDPDYMTGDATLVDTDKVVSGQTGVWQSIYTFSSVYEATSSDPNMNVVAISSPKLKATDQNHLRMGDTGIGLATAISADTKYPELCMQLLDYLFTEEGSVFANYGEEGVTFEYNEEGIPRYNNTILKNTDGLSPSEATAFYTLPSNTFSLLRDWTRETTGLSEKVLDSYDIWSKDDASYNLPNTLSYTSEEAQEKADILSDINTYFEECTNQFITGVKDIDTEWDEYVSTIKGLKIGRATEIVQSAYNRYNKR